MSTEQAPWSQIVEEHFEHVVRIAMRILGSEHDAEDVAQDVFAEVYRSRDNRLVQNWGGLLSTMATRRAIDCLRRNKRSSVLLDHEHISTVQPCDVAAERELVERLRGALAQLPERQSTVFALVYFEKLSRPEIAVMLQTSEEAVSTALYKARQRLKSQFSTQAKGESR